MGVHRLALAAVAAGEAEKVADQLVQAPDLTPDEVEEAVEASGGLGLFCGSVGAANADNPYDYSVRGKVPPVSG